MSDASHLRTACPNCGVRYRLDPTRLRGSQANIKCSGCGTIFRVRVTQGARDSSAPYVVTRAATGVEVAVPSLDTLKRWIIEGKVLADDALAKAGGTARRLGDIQHFQPFLRVGERSGSFNALPGRDGVLEDVEPVRDDSSVEEPSEAEAAEDVGARASEAEVAEAADAVYLDRDTIEEEGAADVEEPLPESTVVTAPTPAVREAETERRLEARDDDEDLPIKLERGMGSRVAIGFLIVLVLAAVALAAIYLAAPDTFYELLPFLK